MKASLQDFVTTGCFGSLAPGLSRAAVQEILGPPDGSEECADNYHAWSIWNYGDVEFHFAELHLLGEALWMIFMDDFSTLSGGSKIELDAWIISGRLTVSEAERRFNKAGMSYRKENSLHAENGIKLTSAANTVLMFYGESAHRVTLHAIHRSSEPA